MDVDDRFDPVTRDDVAEDNPRMIVGELRALQREVRSGFELVMARLLTAIERMSNRQDDQADRISELERRVDALEARFK